MGFLELKIPPPLIFLLAAASMMLAASAWPTLALQVPGKSALCTLLTGSGLLCDLAGLLAFWKFRTSINPLRPERAQVIVNYGIYRFSRNPMYLGQLLLLAACALRQEHLLALALLPAYIAYLTRFQIIPEERILSAKFGASYAAYQQRVRRWV